MSPRLSRIGALGTALHGRGRYWIALLGASGASTDIYKGCSSDGLLFAAGGQFTPTTLEVHNWSVWSRSGALLADRQSSGSESYTRACCPDGSGGAYVANLVYTTTSEEHLYRVNAAGDIVWSAGEDTTYRNICEALAASGSYLYGKDGSGRLVRLSTSDGSLVWWLDSADLEVVDVAVDGSGNAYLVGYYGSEWRLVKVNSSGVFQWGHSLTEGTLTNRIGGKVHVADGYVYVSAGYSDYSTNDACFVAKFSDGGTHQWTTVLTYIGSDGLDTDAVGNVYAGSADGGFVQLDSSGALQWSGLFTVSGARALFVDGDALVLMGRANGSPSEADAGFVARIPLDGSGHGTYGFDFVGDAFTIVYGAGSVSTAAYTITLTSLSLTFTTSTDTSPVTPDSMTDAGLSRVIATV